MKPLFDKVLFLICTLCIFSSCSQEPSASEIEQEAAAFIESWNTALNTKDYFTLDQLYADDQVLYYDTYKSGESCVKSKKNALTKVPHFKQTIQPNSFRIINRDQIIDCFFTKSDNIKSSTVKNRSFEAYIRLRRAGESFKIIVEGDHTTDSLRKTHENLISQGEQVQADFTGDGQDDILYEVLQSTTGKLYPKSVLQKRDYQSTRFYSVLKSKNSVLPDLPILKATGGIEVLLDEGDLNLSGGHELSIVIIIPQTDIVSHRLYTYVDDGWRLLYTAEYFVHQIIDYQSVFSSIGRTNDIRIRKNDPMTFTVQTSSYRCGPRQLYRLNN